VSQGSFPTANACSELCERGCDLEKGGGEIDFMRWPESRGAWKRGGRQTTLFCVGRGGESLLGSKGGGTYLRVARSWPHPSSASNRLKGDVRVNMRKIRRSHKDLGGDNLVLHEVSQEKANS